MVQVAELRQGFLLDGGARVAMREKGWGERHRVGFRLMELSLAWLDRQGVKKKVVVVGVGNEEVFNFYARFGFHPRSINLEQIST